MIISPDSKQVDSYTRNKVANRIVILLKFDLEIHWCNRPENCGSQDLKLNIAK